MNKIIKNLDKGLNQYKKSNQLRVGRPINSKNKKIPTKQTSISFELPVRKVLEEESLENHISMGVIVNNIVKKHYKL